MSQQKSLAYFRYRSTDETKNNCTQEPFYSYDLKNDDSTNKAKFNLSQNCWERKKAKIHDMKKDGHACEFNRKMFSSTEFHKIMMFANDKSHI